MSIEEAKDYVDLVIETLVQRGKITEQAYGSMTEDFRNRLAELVKEKSEE